MFDMHIVLTQEHLPQWLSKGVVPTINSSILNHLVQTGHKASQRGRILLYNLPGAQQIAKIIESPHAPNSRGYYNSPQTTNALCLKEASPASPYCGESRLLANWLTLIYVNV
uniref:Uncharacterized protein n=1 Tax=Trichobilharzia regenti TaxID=157069 RepID=A0AA85J650_TRIRE|nr:unnamed protein product [Trichobilharzia regenti]